MQLNNGIGLRESLEQLETAGLDELLRAELEKEIPDADTVRLVMSILEQRNKTSATELTPSQEAAWQRYQQRMETLAPKPRPFRKWIAAAACVVLVLAFFLAAMPQKVQAESFWQMMQRISDSVISFFSSEAKKTEIEYVFVTDNPGLQKVYDTAVEWGVTAPMVPMWLPDNSDFLELNVETTPVSKSMWAYFDYQETGIVLQMNMYNGKPARQFYRDAAFNETYEKNGTTYSITQNTEWWAVVWTKDNIECFLTLDCDEDTLRRILESIYVTED